MSRRSECLQTAPRAPLSLRSGASLARWRAVGARLRAARARGARQSCGRPRSLKMFSRSAQISLDWWDRISLAAGLQEVASQLHSAAQNHIQPAAAAGSSRNFGGANRRSANSSASSCSTSSFSSSSRRSSPTFLYRTSSSGSSANSNSICASKSKTRSRPALGDGGKSIIDYFAKQQSTSSNSLVNLANSRARKHQYNHHQQQQQRQQQLQKEKLAQRQRRQQTKQGHSQNPLLAHFNFLSQTKPVVPATATATTRPRRARAEQQLAATKSRAPEPGKRRLVSFDRFKAELGGWLRRLSQEAE